jgi:hypothetical protein
MTMRILLSVALLIAACQKGDGLVVVTVTAMPAIENVATLHAKSTVGSKSAEFDVPVGSTSTLSDAQSFDFGIDVPLKYGGNIRVEIEARDSAGTPLASGVGTGKVSAGRRTEVPVVLGGGAVDMGAMDLRNVDLADLASMQPMCTTATTKKDCKDPGKPICDTGGSCVACTDSSDDAQCAAHMNGKPRCNSTSGQCVACRADTQAVDCAAATPICGSDNVCRGCVAHSECPSHVCEISTGACVDASKVALVDHGGLGVSGCNNARAGTQNGNDADHAWCDIQPALTNDIRLYFLMTGYGIAGNGYSFISSIPHNVTIIGPGRSAAKQAVIAADVSHPAVSCTTAIDVVLDGLEVADARSGHPGIEFDAAGTLVVRNSLVVDNNIGISFSGLALTVTGCTIARNYYGPAVDSSTRTIS